MIKPGFAFSGQEDRQMKHFFYDAVTVRVKTAADKRPGSENERFGVQAVGPAL